MKKTYNVLLIDDHPLIVDGFENALNYVSNENDAVAFRVHRANDCETAYYKIKEFVPTQKLDLAILDISLPSCAKLKLHSGEDLGVLLRQLLPETIIMVCTFFTNTSRLHQILKRINPKGFMVKSDIDHMGLTVAIKEVLADKFHYTKTIRTMLRQKSLNEISLTRPIY